MKNTLKNIVTLSNYSMFIYRWQMYWMIFRMCLGKEPAVQTEVWNLGFCWSGSVSQWALADNCHLIYSVTFPNKLRLQLTLAERGLFHIHSYSLARLHPTVSLDNSWSRLNWQGFGSYELETACFAGLVYFCWSELGVWQFCLPLNLFLWLYSLHFWGVRNQPSRPHSF